MTVKNLFSLFVVLQLIVVPVVAVHAAPTLTEEQKAELDAKKTEVETTLSEAKDSAIEVAKEKGVEFTDFQNRLIAGIDKADNAVKKAIDNINAVDALADETKEELTDALYALDSLLLEYRSAVNEAETMADLEAINKQVVAALKENKDVIIAAIKESSLVIAEQVSQSIDKIMIKVEASLKMLDVECDSDAFAQISALAAQLETTNTALKAAIEAKDVATAKTQAKAAIQISADLAKEFSQLIVDCQDSLD